MIVRPLRHDSGSVSAPIVVDAIVSGLGSIVDVRVPARNAVIQIAGAIGEGDVVRSDQPIPAVANLRTPPEIDPGERERVRSVLGRAMGDRELEPRRSEIRWRRPPIGTAQPGELDMKVRVRPLGFGAGHIHGLHRQARHLTARRSQPIDDALAQRRLSVEHRLEPRPRLSGRRHDGHRDPVERKNVSASSCRLDLPFDRLDDRMRDRQWLPGARSRHSLYGAVKRARDRRFQPACFSQDIHGTPFSSPVHCNVSVRL